tara:strand:+ start:110 stop:502 length:393 start_codon:yes stop_codon:yes gene_type:complete
MMKTILMIDDSEVEQFLNEAIIQEFDPNIRILKAYDGIEGLELLAELDFVPDAILLDINMPRMNGHEFLEEYSKTMGDAKVPVVVMLTSSEQHIDREKAQKHECVKDYFLKPLNSAQLSELMNLRQSVGL